MATVRRIVELGRAARAEGRVRVRQPLARAMVGVPGFADLPDELRAEIAGELNVSTVEPLAADLVSVTVKPNFRALGARFGSRTQEVARAVAGAGRPVDGRLAVLVNGEPVELSDADVLVTETVMPGWAVAGDGGESVAVDLTLTAELVHAGLVRDALRGIQDARKSTGLAVTDRIALWWRSTRDDVADALRGEHAMGADEVLASSVGGGAPALDLPSRHFDDLGLTVWVSRSRSLDG